MGMSAEWKLTGYFAGALFSGQELYGNWALAGEINKVSQEIVQIDLPQDLSAQQAGDGKGTRAADYLAMIQRDFVLANMNGPELDSGTVAEYVVASMLGMPRVQLRSDFRKVGDAPSDFPDPITVCKTAAVPYNLMLGHDESSLVFVNSMELYKSASSPQEFVRKLAVAAVGGIKLAFERTETARPEEYAFYRTALVRSLRLDAAKVADILEKKRQRHVQAEYHQACERLSNIALG
jgi:nucleoside 2-deoxyribosyltransferase